MGPMAMQRQIEGRIRAQQATAERLPRWVNAQMGAPHRVGRAFTHREQRDCHDEVQMSEYRCRVKTCHRLLFRSDAERGRVEIVCPARDCRTQQTVYLGGYQRAGGATTAA